jgi:hypothetical protein
MLAERPSVFTDDPSSPPTWIQLHVNGHPAGRPTFGYRVIAPTPLDAVR